MRCGLAGQNANKIRRKYVLRFPDISLLSPHERACYVCNLRSNTISVVPNFVQGSEHLINGQRYAMELHMVHYNGSYADQSAALASGDKDALSVRCNK